MTSLSTDPDLLDPVAAAGTSLPSARSGRAVVPADPPPAGPARSRTGSSDGALTFADRHIGPGEQDVAHMLATLGFDRLDDLVEAAVPRAIREDAEFDLPAPATEAEVTAELRALAARNTLAVPMIGLGYFGTHTPAVIRRCVLENPSWYTAYTPYQAEISQGRLEALLVFQTMIAELTDLPVANASLLDEATAAAEAVMVMRRVSRTPQDAVLLVDEGVLPQTCAVIATRTAPLGIDVVTAPLDGRPPTDLTGGRPVFGVLLQYPDADGRVRDLTPVVEAAHGQGALVTVAADLLALALLRPPGEYGADLAVGSAQRFGVPLGFGGPHAGYLAARAELTRNLPGRIVGVSRDATETPALRLALQTREQHIRRERATSNICTAQVLLAVMAGMYAVHHGPAGLAEIARRVAGQAAGLARDLRAEGVPVVHEAFFDTVLAQVPGRAAAVVAAARDRGVLLRAVDADHVAISCDETTRPEHLDRVRAAFTSSGTAAPLPEPPAGSSPAPGSRSAVPGLPAALLRQGPCLRDPVFTRHRSETSLLRYLRRLSDLDYALDRGMIPLGSCTMKLNAATEMEPVSWPEFAGLHPFAPPEHTAGTRALIDDLCAWLAGVTGYDAVSLQPNAGSQGELAGLLAIRAYLRDQGSPERDVCLIPASAHGTNAASAAMAGLRVVVVRCDAEGNVDADHLRESVTAHRDRLAALMITYPSTHGVFEEHVPELCALVHEAGGQVYVDGANLNALVGLARPGRFGADVSHLNLHKTFCIPHGGGGPGVGPVAVRAHLSPYLPGHPLQDPEHSLPDRGHPGRDRGHRRQEAAGTRVGPVAAAPYGSAGILPIAWAYLRLMGAEGLARASATAVLSANYLAARLDEHFPVLYRGVNGLVAHECILDLRELTRLSGITVTDVAKRLMDYGFHAPTMSFPVPGTLMAEPTESEDLAELDRFCDAMIEIRHEIDQVIEGRWPAELSPLRGAPHPASVLSAEEWDRPYSRTTAVFPPGVEPRHKYWPPVGRVDDAYGDRNLVCHCF